MAVASVNTPIKDTMGATFSAGFDITAKTAIDGRMSVKLTTDLTDKRAWASKSGSATVTIVPIIKPTININQTFLLLTKSLPILLPINSIDIPAPKVNKAEPKINNNELSINDIDISISTGVKIIINKTNTVIGNIVTQALLKLFLNSSNTL